MLTTSSASSNCLPSSAPLMTNKRGTRNLPGSAKVYTNGNGWMCFLVGAFGRKTGDKETGRQGEELRICSPCLLASLSPCLCMAASLLQNFTQLDVLRLPPRVLRAD